MAGGFVRKSRDILNKEWFKKQNVAHFYDALLMLACYRPETKRGVQVKAGTVVMTLEELMNATGLSKKEVRTALKTLELSGDILIDTNTGNRRFHIIVISDYPKIEEKVSEPEKPTNNSTQQVRNKF